MAGGGVRDDGHEEAGHHDNQRVGAVQVLLVRLLEGAAQAENDPACGSEGGRAGRAARMGLAAAATTCRVATAAAQQAGGAALLLQVLQPRHACLCLLQTAEKPCDRGIDRPAQPPASTLHASRTATCRPSLAPTCADQRHCVQQRVDVVLHHKGAEQAHQQERRRELLRAQRQACRRRGSAARAMGHMHAAGGSMMQRRFAAHSTTAPASMHHSRGRAARAEPACTEMCPLPPSPPQPGAARTSCCPLLDQLVGQQANAQEVHALRQDEQRVMILHNKPQQQQGLQAASGGGGGRQE